jgi:glycosidase
MAQIRKNEQVLIYGDFKLIDVENPSIFAFTRSFQDRTLLVMLNFKAESATLKTELDLTDSQVIIGNYAEPSRNGTLQPYEGVIVELK